MDSQPPPCCCPDPAPDLGDDIQLEKEITSRGNCLAALHLQLLPAIFVQEIVDLLFTMRAVGQDRQETSSVVLAPVADWCLPTSVGLSGTETQEETR